MRVLLEALNGFDMKKNDVTCHECGSGFQRLELISGPGTTGETAARFANRPWSLSMAANSLPPALLFTPLNQPRLRTAA
jgi:hypothetical protein